MTKLTLREEWEARVADFRASGKTAKAWCDEHLRLPMKGPSSHDVLTLKVGNVALEVRPGFDPALLADVIKVLKAL